MKLPFSRSERMTWEHSILRTAMLCLIALGAIMVYSASSGTTLLGEGDSSYYLKRYVGTAIVGLIVLGYTSRAGLDAVRRATPFLLVASFAGLLLVLVPGFGLEVNGARRWLGAGPIQVQPSEIAKLALVLYAAGVIAADPRRTRSLQGVRPLLIVGAVMAALVVVEPDLGTAIVICVTLAAILVAAGVEIRQLAMLAGGIAALALIAIMIEPYRRERFFTFLDPWADTQGAGFQSVQAMIAIGSGGAFGVGLGESVQKLFYLPEAHTDMILAVIGEELGFAGIFFVLFLYGMIAYAGLRAARTARDLYAKLLAAGITSVILSQATINFFAVLGVLPLTGVPLPFISYGNSSLIVLLASMGILINIAQEGAVRTRARPREEPEEAKPRAGRDAKRRGARSVRSRAKRAQSGVRRWKHLVVHDGGRAKKTRPRAKGSSSARAAGSQASGRQAAIRKLVDAENRDRSRRDSRARRAGAGGRRRASR